MGKVADHFGVELVLAGRNIFQLDIALVVREGEVGDGRVSLGNEIHGGPADRLGCLRILEREFYIDVHVALDHVIGDDLRM